MGWLSPRQTVRGRETNRCCWNPLQAVRAPALVGAGSGRDRRAYRRCMRRWPLFRNRDYMLFWSGQALSELGSQTSTVAYPLLVLALTGSAAKAGVVGLARWLPLAIFAIPA